MGFEIEYLKKRYREMSSSQLELIIEQIKRELEHHPEPDYIELQIAVDALEEMNKAAHEQKKNRPFLPGRFEYQLDVGEEY
ncbi:MAG: hypothetical protein K0A89_07335 [ANME-2 cluster archaeon]|nr:hypothetical protein [ANME-2 cluster archaeon]MDF1532470.1 hypothetical protein [ANME-2 cluster archaeon]MDW7776843.1 hypothetical protein [Methanosarcinales archaeon]